MGSLLLTLILGLGSPVHIAAAVPSLVHDHATGTTTSEVVDGTPLATQSATAFGEGDVFVAVGNGQVQWRLPDGTLNATLDTGLGGYTTGMTFDKVPGDLYVTDFSAGAVSRFDKNGNRLATFGSGYNALPESIVFDAAGDAYVGQAGGTGDVLRFDGGGQLRASYDVPIEDVGSDWTDLEADQCTLLYTSEGTRIKRFDVCHNAPMSDLTALLHHAYALRILPGGRAVLVADSDAIRVVDGITGGVSQSYDAPGQDCWFALNLDPDGTSFWSADFCTSTVYKFDIASGAILESFSTGTPSNTVFGLVVNGEFSDARNRDCSSQDLSLGQAGANGDQVVVRYDPRYLVDESKANYTTQAQAMAERIRSRAVSTLAEYQNLLGFSIPDHVTIEIDCEIRALGIKPVNAPGLTETENLVKLSADDLRRWMLDPTNNDSNATWKTLVDHELQHTIQFKASGLVIPFLNQADVFLRYSTSDATNMESGAVLAQDLIAESDDAALHFRSYLDFVGRWFGAPTTVAAGPDDGNSDWKYRAAAFLQYVGERYGTGSTPETKVADYLRRLYGTTTGMAAIGRAASANANDLLRDFYVASLTRRAPNASHYPNDQILDEIQLHGGLPGTPPAYPPLTVPSANTKSLATAQFTGQHLTRAQGAVFVINTLNGVSSVRVKVSRSLLASLTQDTTRLAFIPTSSDGSVLVDPRYMPDGPNWLDDSWVVPVAGQAGLAIVMVAGDTDADFDLTVENAGGTSTIDLIQPTAANPLPPLESACPNTYIPVTVRPAVNGAFSNGLSAPAFTATLDGTAVPVSSAFERIDTYTVYLRPTTKPSVGNHAVRITFNGVLAPQVGQVSVVQTTSCSTDREIARSASLGTLGQGATATADIAVVSGDSGATFGLTWSGSDFDLQLVSPSGRTITETTIANDVHVVQGSSSVQITVDSPQAGTWRLAATGVSVPSPEAVSYNVTEIGTAVRSELSATNQGGAGNPIAVRLALTDSSLGLVGGTVEATITDPVGTQRHFALFDDGGHGDTSPNDGVYGTLAWATDLAGSYHVVVSAAATRTDGSTVQRQEEADVILGSKVDTDGDGVADASEAIFGLNPTNPSDGAVDFDGDGLGLASELSAGLDPFSWDTDRGGENDASELAAGRDPRRAGDDHGSPPVLLSAVAKDGNLVTLFSATTDESGQIHLYRFAGTNRTDLGLRAGTHATFDDGPLASGTYRYAAVAVAADGAESAPQFSSPIAVAADVTAPFVRISANDGVWATSSRDARIVFTDLSEPVTQMRIAESDSALANAAWVTFTNPTTFTITQTAGRHFVLAQVRDAAGNASAVVAAIVDYTPTSDTIPPTSQSGTLNATYTTNTVSIPFTASDSGGSGLASVELWARYRSNESQLWGTWTKVATGLTSPFVYTFAGGDGNYEFYTVAVDGAGNRETVPATADSSTRRDAIDNPPDFRFSSLSAEVCSSLVCPLSPGTVKAVLQAEGTAADDRTAVSVSWQLWGVKANGQRQKLFSYKTATPSDGAFNSRVEGFSLFDNRTDGGYVSYDVDLKVTAGTATTTRTTRVLICRQISGCAP